MTSGLIEINPGRIALYTFSTDSCNVELLLQKTFKSNKKIKNSLKLNQFDFPFYYVNSILKEGIFSYKNWKVMLSDKFTPLYALSIKELLKICNPDVSIFLIDNHLRYKLIKSILKPNEILIWIEYKTIYLGYFSHKRLMVRRLSEPYTDVKSITKNLVLHHIDVPIKRILFAIAPIILANSNKSKCDLRNILYIKNIAF